MSKNHSKVGKRCDHFNLSAAEIFAEDGTNLLRREDGTPVTFTGYNKKNGQWYGKYVYKIVEYTTTTCPLCDADCRYDESGVQTCEEECGGFIDHEPLDFSLSSVGRL